MKQIAPLLTLLAGSLASPALASPFIDYPDDPGFPTDGVVEIVVEPEDLERCEATLAMVTGSPLVPLDEAGQAPIQVDAEIEPMQPVAICVSEPRPRPNS